MNGEHSVGRVIARPFRGEPGHFVRTDGRRDFALPPPSRSYLDEVQEAGLPVHAVGKVTDLFAGVGHRPCAPRGDQRGGDRVGDGAARLAGGGSRVREPHRDRPGLRPPQGRGRASTARCARSTTRWPAGSSLLRAGDLLVLTSDHGVRPGRRPHRPHARARARCWPSSTATSGRRHDGPLADVGASALRWLTGRDAGLPGEPFV